MVLNTQHLEIPHSRPSIPTTALLAMSMKPLNNHLSRRCSNSFPQCGVISKKEVVSIVSMPGIVDLYETKGTGEVGIVRVLAPSRAMENDSEDEGMMITG